MAFGIDSINASQELGMAEPLFDCTHRALPNGISCYCGKDLHVIVDNYSAHKHKKVVEWASKRRRLTLHFTPTYASWLNRIGIWISIYTRDVIGGDLAKQAGTA